MVAIPIEDDWLKRLPLALLAVGIGSLAFAFHAQYVQGLEPCILCLVQRVPFYAAIALGLAAFAKPDWMVAAGWLAGGIFLAGGAVAFYHVGVEQHWWAAVTACGGELPQQMSITDFQSALQSKPEKACDKVDWTLFGLSMTTYNVAYSAGLGAVTLWAANQLRKRA